MISSKQEIIMKSWLLLDVDEHKSEFNTLIIQELYLLFRFTNKTPVNTVSYSVLCKCWSLAAGIF